MPMVERGLSALARLAHRGGVDADGRSGDGAGLLVGIPKAFFRKVARVDGIRTARRVWRRHGVSSAWPGRSSGEGDSGCGCEI